MSQTNYNELIQQRLDDLNLTIYGASRMIGAETDTDEDLKTLEQRIRRYCKSDPESLTKWIEIIEALGGKVLIKWN